MPPAKSGVQGVVEAVGRRARRQHDAAGPEQVLRVDLHPGDDRLDVGRVGQHEFGHVAHQVGGDGGGDVAVVGEVAGPAGNIGSAPDSLQGRRQLAGAGDDVVAGGIELLFDQCPVRILVARELQQFFGGPLVVGAAAEVETHPVEEFAVEPGVAIEQSAVVGGKLLEGVLHFLHHRLLRIVEQADVDEKQDAVRARDDERAVVPRLGRPARCHHPRVTLERLDAARVGLGETVAVGQPGVAGRALDVGNVFLEDLVGALVDVGIRIELVARFPRFQREPAVECRLRCREQQHRHARRAGDEHPALEDSAVVRPVDRRLAGLEIHRAGVVADLALRLAADREVEGRNEEVRVHEAVLPREIELEFAGLLVESLVDEPPDLEQAGRLIERHHRGAHRQKQTLVREDDPLVQRAAQGVGADRAVAANEAFLPGLRGLGTDESALRNRQGL